VRRGERRRGPVARALSDVTPRDPALARFSRANQQNQRFATRFSAAPILGE
jgi:hypothetical protein